MILRGLFARRERPPRCRWPAGRWVDGECARAVRSCDAGLVPWRLRAAHHRPDRRVGGDLGGPARSGGGAHRVGQDAVGVPVGHRPGLPREGGGARSRRRRGHDGHEAEEGHDAEEACDEGCRWHRHPLHLSAEGARRRRGAQPAFAPGRHRTGRATPRHPPAGDHRGGALGRHALGRPAQTRHRPAGHPHHDAGIAVPHAHLAGGADPPGRPHRDRRRGARRRRHQTGRAPGGQPRAPRRAASRRRSRPPAGAAHRTVGDRPADRRGRPLPRRVRSRGDRRAARDQGVRPEGRRADGGHAQSAAASPCRRRDGDGCRGERRSGRRRRLVRPIAAVRDHRLGVAARRGGDRRSDPRAPVDDRVRELASARRAAHRTAQRDLRGASRPGCGFGDGRRKAARRDDGAGGGVGRGAARAGEGAPRLGVQGAARAGRGRAEIRHPALRRRDQFARARHRHGRGRPRHPGRGAALGGVGPAACRARRTPGRRGQPRRPVPQAPRRRPAHGGRHGADAGGPDRGGAHPAESARHPRAADDRRVRARTGRCRGMVRDRASLRAVPDAAALRV